MTEIDQKALFRIAKDTGPFVRIAQQFTSGGVQWVGPVVVSPIAVYLVKTRQFRSHGGGGLIGVLLAEALQNNDDGIRTCNINDLPAVVRQAADPRGKLPGKPVIIIPKSTVHLMQAATINNVVSVQSGSDTFKLMPNPFAYHFGTKATLRQLGWTLNQLLVPEDAPIHDLRTPDEKVAGPVKPLWQRILFIAAAIILFILVCLAKTGFHH